MCRDTLLLDDWNTTRIRNLGALYTITDFTSLLVVRRMQWTTALHHVCVIVFNAFSMRNGTCVYGRDAPACVCVLCVCVTDVSVSSTMCYACVHVGAGAQCWAVSKVLTIIEVVKGGGGGGRKGVHDGRICYNSYTGFCADLQTAMYTTII